MSEEPTPYRANASATPAGPVLKPLPSVPGVHAWRTVDTWEAALCLRFALAFNTLDDRWVDGALAPEAIYDAQRMFKPVRGQDAVADFLRRKIRGFRRDRREWVRCELATLENGRPCVAMFYNPEHPGCLITPRGTAVFAADSHGRIDSIYVITESPDPDKALRSGIFPPLAIIG